VQAGGNGSAASAVLGAAGTYADYPTVAGVYDVSTTRQAACGNGSAVVSNNTLDFTGVGTTTLTIGDLSSSGAAVSPANGNITDVVIYDAPFTDAQLRSGTLDFGSQAFFNGSVLTTGGKIHVTEVSLITTWNGGIPLAADGALCVQQAAPASFSQGVGITASGRVAVELVA
jgi:hypothetical protein